MRSPPQKRVKLELSPTPSIEEIPDPRTKARTEPGDQVEAEADGEHCSICLQPIVDRTVIPTCSHEFCFECLLLWTEQSRRCPLCSQTIGDYLIHHIRSKYDYQKHFLTPLRTSPRPVAALREARRHVRARREREWGRQQRRDWEEADELERAIEKRRWIYRHGLYAKHVASNVYTRYRPFPTPAQFTASPDIVSRATAFVRRELRVWVGLDVEFLTTFILSLMKSLDIRSEPAVRLLAEFLDLDSGGERVNAEHFAHELYCYLRSPYRDISVYDKVVQYDVPEDLPPPTVPESSGRWRLSPRSRSRSQSRSRSRHHHSPSPSPSRLSDHHRPLYDQRHSPRTSRHALRRRRSSRSFDHTPPIVERNMPEERMGRGRSPPPHPKHDRDGRSDAKDRNDIGHSNETRERRLEYYGQHIPRGTVRESRVESPQEGQPDGNDVKGKGRAPLDRPVFHERAMDVTTPRRTDTDDTSFPDAKNSICNATQIFPTVSDSYTSSAAPIPSSVPSVAASNRASSSTANIRHADFPRTTHGPSDVSGPQPAESPSNPSVVAAMSTDASGKMTALGPVRISNRNILESVQKYLAGNGSVRAQHSKNRREFAIEPSSSTPMILGERKMSSPRDRSLDTNTPYVPNISLLQHPSDPGPASSAAHRVSEFQHPPTNSVDSLRTDRHATMSAPEIMTRTRARLARLKEGASEIVSSAPSIASLSIDEHPEKGKPARQSANASADGLVERKSGPISITSPLPNQSPNLDHPYGTAESDTISTSTLTSTLRTSRSTSSSGTSALQREALLRKLAAEKRRQDHPTSTSDSLPANSRAHSISNESVPMGVHSGNNADHLDLTQVPPPETSPVARAAEREATLRSQAQLRIRLAAVKRASADQSNVKENGVSVDRNQPNGGDNAASREELLKAKLIQRRT